MKLLLYCCKAKPYLVDLRKDFNNINFDTFNNKEILNTGWNILNGKIVAECDYEIGDIIYPLDFYRVINSSIRITTDDLFKNSCLTEEQLDNYLHPHYRSAFLEEKVWGYAIVIQNVHIFDEPKELKEFYYYDKYDEMLMQIEKAPQNMIYAYNWLGNEKKVLISIRPEWLCKILNDEKTIEIRKKVLKGMFK